MSTLSNSPLAGITLTFQKPHASVTWDGTVVDTYFHGHYVEYATGFKMHLVATGYTP